MHVHAEGCVEKDHGKRALLHLASTLLHAVVGMFFACLHQRAVARLCLLPDACRPRGAACNAGAFTASIFAGDGFGARMLQQEWVVMSMTCAGIVQFACGCILGPKNRWLGTHPLTVISDVDAYPSNVAYHKLCRDARAVRGHLLEKFVSGTGFVGDLGRAHHLQELRLGRCQMVSNPVKGRVSSMDEKATEELVVNMKSCPVLSCCGRGVQDVYCLLVCTNQAIQFLTALSSQGFRNQSGLKSHMQTARLQVSGLAWLPLQFQVCWDDKSQYPEVTIESVVGQSTMLLLCPPKKHV